jgi:hypothetical protein
MKEIFYRLFFGTYLFPAIGLFLFEKLAALFRFSHIPGQIMKITLK